MSLHSSVLRKGPESAMLAALDEGNIKLDKKLASLQVRLCDGRRSDELPLDTVWDSCRRLTLTHKWSNIAPRAC